MGCASCGNSSVYKLDVTELDKEPTTIIIKKKATVSDLKQKIEKEIHDLKNVDYLLYLRN
jgi:hypothetical protein